MHQVPLDSITPSSQTSPAGSLPPPLVHFPSISPFIIPRQSVASTPLTLLLAPAQQGQPALRLLTQPTVLKSEEYVRNEFLFAFSLLLGASTSFASYLPLVSKLASLFAHLEETSHFLSRDAAPPNSGRIFALCETLLEDLNNYSETMIPLDAANTLNIKLFPSYPEPPRVAAHHVPLATVRLAALVDENWDLTVRRVVPFVNGVNCVRRIAALADAELGLARDAVRHLLYYGCVMLLDVFHFGASYAPTAEMDSFVEENLVWREAVRYVTRPPLRRWHGGDDDDDDDDDEGSDEDEEEERGPDGGLDSTPPIDEARLVELYCSLRPGQSLRQWVLNHAAVARTIDVRRFVTFGVIKGFLYRVHKYPLWLGSGNTRTHGIAAIVTTTTTGKWKNVTQQQQVGDEQGRTAEAQRLAADAKLRGFLDGTHCFDEICTELEISEKELLQRLKDWGDVQIIQK